MHLRAFTINPSSNTLLIVRHYLYVVLENGPLHAPKLVFELHTSIFFLQICGQTDYKAHHTKLSISPRLECTCFFSGSFSCQVSGKQFLEIRISMEEIVARELNLKCLHQQNFLLKLNTICLSIQLSSLSSAQQLQILRSETHTAPCWCQAPD